VRVATVSFMRMPNDWLDESVQLSMVDRHTAATAPVVLWGAVRSLTGGQRPTALMVRMATTGSHTEWRAIWMTDSLVGLAVTTKAEERWTAYSNDVRAENVTSWARPLHDIQSVELDAVECTQVRGHGEREQEWRWSAGARVLFSDGAHIQVPPFGTPMDDQHDAEIQAFLDAITSR
jgi:hypothetical protein